MKWFNWMVRSRFSKAGALALVIACVVLQSPAVIAAPFLLAEVSASDAASLVVKKTGGKVLKVTEEERDGRWMYRVKVLLPQGRVKTIMVNKETGSVGG